MYGNTEPCGVMRGSAVEYFGRWVRYTRIVAKLRIRQKGCVEEAQKDYCGVSDLRLFHIGFLFDGTLAGARHVQIPISKITGHTQ